MPDYSAFSYTQTVERHIPSSVRVTTVLLYVVVAMFAFIGLFLSRSVLAEEVISTHHESGVPGITIIAAEGGILVGFSLAGFDNDKLVVVILDSFIVNHPIMLGDINASYRKTVTVHVHRVR